jgi:hypothetical protein
MPDKSVLSGQHCRLEPLTLAHGKGLLAAFRADDEGVIWDFLPYGPFDSWPAFEAFLEASCLATDPFSMRSSTAFPTSLSAWRVTCGSRRRMA